PVNPAALAAKAEINAFPAYPPLGDPGVQSGNLEIANASASGVFYLSSDSTNGSGNISQHRVWLRAPAADYERKFRALRIVRDTVDPNGGSATHTVQSAATLDFTIPANQQY